MPYDGSNGAEDFLPARLSLSGLRAAAQHCRGCPLYADATQVVFKFSEGKKAARIVMVGEQPGDKEDLDGRPFVGPAGQYLRNELRHVEIPLDEVYLTNAVKHFKWQLRGKRRLHSKPGKREVVACRPWLESELALLTPQILILLGATASQSLLGANFRVSQQRGEAFSSQWADWTIATYHPSAVLRSSGQVDGHAIAEAFRSDLAQAARQLRKSAK